MGFRSVFWGVLDQAGHKSPSSPTTPAPALNKYIYIWGELNISMVFDALREKKSMGVPVGGVLDGLQKRENREKWGLGQD